MHLIYKFKIKIKYIIILKNIKNKINKNNKN